MVSEREEYVQHHIYRKWLQRGHSWYRGLKVIVGYVMLGGLCGCRRQDDNFIARA